MATRGRRPSSRIKRTPRGKQPAKPRKRERAGWNRPVPLAAEHCEELLDCVGLDTEDPDENGKAGSCLKTVSEVLGRYPGFEGGTRPSHVRAKLEPLYRDGKRFMQRLESTARSGLDGTDIRASALIELKMRCSREMLSVAEHLAELEGYDSRHGVGRAAAKMIIRQLADVFKAYWQGGEDLNGRSLRFEKTRKLFIKAAFKAAKKPSPSDKLILLALQ